MATAWRTSGLVMLLLGSSADAFAFMLTEPAICYILDGVLLLYCVVATVLFFRVKLGKPSRTPEPLQEETYAQLQPGANDEYEDISKTAATRRKPRAEASSETYQALLVTDDVSDAYQVISSKGRKKKEKKPNEPQQPIEESQPSEAPPPLPPH